MAKLIELKRRSDDAKEVYDKTCTIIKSLDFNIEDYQKYIDTFNVYCKAYSAYRAALTK